MSISLKTPAFDLLVRLIFNASMFRVSAANELRKWINKAGVFVLPVLRTEELAMSYPEYLPFEENRIFPFPTTAIEDELGVVFTCPSAAEDSPVWAQDPYMLISLQKQFGKGPWIFTLLKYDRATFHAQKESFDNPTDARGRIIQVHSAGDSVVCGVDDSRDADLFELPLEVKETIHGFGITRMLLEFAWIMSPGRYVISRSSSEQECGRKLSGTERNLGKRRELYTVLERDGVKRLFEGGDATSFHSSLPLELGHHRRAFFRKLRAERYGDNRGKLIPVRETWVGPTETKIDGKTYKVILKGGK